MRGIATMVGAAVFGAVAYYGISQWFGGEPAVESPPSTVAATVDGGTGGKDAGGKPSTPGSTTTSPEAGPPVAVVDPDPPESESPEPPTGAQLVRPPPAVGPKFHVGAPSETPEVKAFIPIVPDTGPDPAFIRSVEQDLRQARTLFASGQEDEGIRLVKQIYAVAKDVSELDMAEDVARVMYRESHPSKQREYAEYLARRDGAGGRFELQMLECRKALSIAESSPEAALDAWDTLTLAYWIAGTRERKEEVLALLDPFIDSMVFSGKYSKLLKSYNIQPGDSLTAIAAKFKTTSDSIRRINKLTTDVIQPRQRVRVLPGEAEIFVNKVEYTLSLLVDGRLLREFRVGLGIGDATPEGEFVIHVRQKDPTWWRQGQPALPAGHPDNVLGTRWLGFRETDEQAGIGIHGTNDPTELGKQSSAGCVRMRKDDVELLYDFVGYGTRVTVE